MKINKILCVLFVIAACCFLVGTVNHIVNTQEGWLSSLLLTGGCLCGAFVFYKKKGVFEILHQSTVSCFVCVECGYIELKADKPKDLIIE